jgi:ribosome-associated protein
MQSDDLAVVLARAAEDRKADDIVLLDMRDLVAYTDVFVICSGANARQVRAIAAELRRVAKVERGLLPDGVEGEDSGRWVLVDYGHVVVHVFDRALRGFYDLEGLWMDAPRITLPEIETPAQPTS